MRNRKQVLKVIDNYGQAYVFGDVIKKYHQQLDLLVRNLPTMEWYSFNAIRFDKNDVCTVLNEISSFLYAYDLIEVTYKF